jgi:hypothetical protein
MTFCNDRLTIADGSTNRVRQVGQDGVMRAIAGTGEARSFGDGGPATSAGLFGPSDVACDATGVYVVELLGNKVRRIAPDGTISTVAAITQPSAIDLRPDHTFDVGSNSNGSRIFHVVPGQVPTLLAGGGSVPLGDNIPATTVRLGAVGSMVYDNATSELIFSDMNARRICKVNSAGVLTSLGGNGFFGFAGDNGPVSSAQFNNPFSLAWDVDHSLLVGDGGNFRVRRIARNSLGITSSSMITTVAGNGANGLTGDGGDPLKASLLTPSGIAVDQTGKIYIGQRFTVEIPLDNRVRAIVGASAPQLPTPTTNVSSPATATGTRSATPSQTPTRTATATSTRTGTLSPTVTPASPAIDSTRAPDVIPSTTPTPLETVTLLFDGCASKAGWCIDINLAGDAYRADQMDLWHQDAQAIVDGWLKMAPFNSNYAKALRVWRLDVPSVDGSMGGDTAFRCDKGKGMCAGIDRRVCCEDWRVANAMTRLQAPDRQELIVVVVNSDFDGGSAGQAGFTTVITHQGTFVQRFVHELAGHAMSGACDTYDFGIPNANCVTEPSCPNLAKQGGALGPDGHKWLKNEQAGQAGFFAGGGGCPATSLMRRPAENDIMRDLLAGIEPVTAEAWIRSVRKSVPVAVSVFPNASTPVVTDCGFGAQFSVQLDASARVDTKILWSLNDISVASGPTYNLGGKQLSKGTHKLRVDVIEPDPNVRGIVGYGDSWVHNFWIWTVVTKCADVCPCWGDLAGGPGSLPNGKVTAVDAVFARRMAAESTGSVNALPPSPCADVDGVAGVSLADSDMINAAVTGMINAGATGIQRFPVGPICGRP